MPRDCQMARIHGRYGALYIGVANATAAAEPFVNIKGWKGSFKSDKPDATCLGDTNKVYVAGLPDASFTFDGYFDTTNLQAYTAAQDGLARKFYAYPVAPTTAGTYFYGTGFLDMDLDVGVEGVVAISGTVMAATTVTRVG